MNTESDVRKTNDIYTLDGIELDFNEEFYRAYQLIDESSNFVFVTGKAGTGKSTLLKYFYQKTKKKVVLLAPTGVAALNIGGATIHSFFKFPPKPITEEDIRQYPNNEIYRIIDTIIIDEISMVRSDLLDAIDKFMKINGKDSSKPFGGVQMVFFGDLYQLSPIIADEEETYLFGTYYDSPWFFDAKVIKKVDFYVIELKEVYRQKDLHFIELLDSIRTNQVTQKQLGEINNRFGILHEEDESEPITLTCTNRKAQEINFRKLSRIASPEFMYLGRIEGEFPKRTLPTDIELRLKVGAQVMFLKNDFQRRWVNGTIGKVNSLYNETIKIEVVKNGETLIFDVGLESWEILNFKYDSQLHCIKTEVVGRFTQYPLKLAWAVTIHKSQGLSFENVIIDLENRAFAFGQTYVALSRCVSLEGLTLRRRIRHDDVKVDIVVSSFLESILAKGLIEKSIDEISFPVQQEKTSLTDKESLSKPTKQDKLLFIKNDGLTIAIQQDEEGKSSARYNSHSQETESPIIFNGKPYGEPPKQEEPTFQKPPQLKNAGIEESPQVKDIYSLAQTFQKGNISSNQDFNKKIEEKLPTIVGIIVIILLFAYIGVYTNNIKYQGLKVTQVTQMNSHQTNTITISPKPTIRQTYTNTKINSPTPLPMFYIKVHADRVNLRAGPGTNFEIVGKTNWGEEFAVFQIDDSGEWLRINRNDNVWVAASLVSTKIIQSSATVGLITNAWPNTFTTPTYVSNYNITPTKYKTVTPKSGSTFQKRTPIPHQISKTPKKEFIGLGVNGEKIKNELERYGFVFETKKTGFIEYLYVSQVYKGSFVSLKTYSGYVVESSMWWTHTGNESEGDYYESLYLVQIFIEQLFSYWFDSENWMNNATEEINRQLKSGVISPEVLDSYPSFNIQLDYLSVGDVWTLIVMAK